MPVGSARCILFSPPPPPLHLPSSQWPRLHAKEPTHPVQTSSLVCRVDHIHHLPTMFQPPSAFPQCHNISYLETQGPLTVFNGCHNLQATLLCTLLTSTLFLVTQFIAQEVLTLSQTHPHHLPLRFCSSCQTPGVPFHPFSIPKAFLPGILPWGPCLCLGPHWLEVTSCSKGPPCLTEPAPATMHCLPRIQRQALDFLLSLRFPQSPTNIIRVSAGGYYLTVLSQVVAS